MRQATRARACLLFVALIGCARSGPRPMSVVPTVRDPAPAELRQRYSGTYVHSGGDAERVAVVTAVERGVARMPVFARGIARGALMARAEIRQLVIISFDDAGNVSVLSPGETPEVSAADGTPVRITNRFGDESELTQQFVSGVLVQRGRSESGGGSTTFELRPDGQTLIVRRLMHSSRLPQPIEYTLTYRRQ